MTTGSQPTTMMVIDPDTYPSLASLLGLDFLREVAEREVPWQHPLGMMLAWESQAREQYLTAIDHAAELMVSVLERSPQKARAWIAGSLKKRESFEETVAEMICGARLERLGARAIVAGGRTTSVPWLVSSSSSRSTPQAPGQRRTSSMMSGSTSGIAPLTASSCLV